MQLLKLLVWRQRAAPFDYRAPYILPKVCALWHVEVRFQKQIVELTQYVTTKWRCLLGLGFFVQTWDLLCFTPFLHILPHLSAPYAVSHPNDALGSLSKLTHKHVHQQPLVILSHFGTQTHGEQAPLAGTSATLLTGANQSYNTFIISTPAQVPACWVKSHLGLFECFTALEICNYMVDMGAPGLAGSSLWQLASKQTRCERNSTPQKKMRRTKTAPLMLIAEPQPHSSLCRVQANSIWTITKWKIGVWLKEIPFHIERGSDGVPTFPDSCCCLKEWGFGVTFECISIKKDSCFTQYPYFGNL